MVDTFINGQNAFIKYVDFHESLFSQSFLTIQVRNICKVKKENSAEVSLNEAFF